MKMNKEEIIPKFNKNKDNIDYSQAMNSLKEYKKENIQLITKNEELNRKIQKLEKDSKLLNTELDEVKSVIKGLKKELGNYNQMIYTMAIRPKSSAQNLKDNQSGKTASQNYNEMEKMRRELGELENRLKTNIDWIINTNDYLAERKNSLKKCIDDFLQNILNKRFKKTHKANEISKALQESLYKYKETIEELNPAEGKLDKLKKQIIEKKKSDLKEKSLEKERNEIDLLKQKILNGEFMNEYSKSLINELYIVEEIMPPIQMLFEIIKELDAKEVPKEIPCKKVDFQIETVEINLERKMHSDGLNSKAKNLIKDYIKTIEKEIELYLEKNNLEESKNSETYADEEEKKANPKNEIILINEEKKCLKLLSDYMDKKDVDINELFIQYNEVVKREANLSKFKNFATTGVISELKTEVIKQGRIINENKKKNDDGVRGSWVCHPLCQKWKLSQTY